MGRKNVLVSAYFAKNVGDDLFLKVLFDRYEHVNWHLLTADRQYEEMYKNYPHVNITSLYREIGTINMFISWANLTNHFAKYDAFVMIGGSIFMQNKQWKKILTIRNKLIRLLNKCEVPAYIIGANFGPYEDRLFKEKYEQHFLSYKSICFRDLYSYNQFKCLSNINVAPDAILTLATESKKRQRNCIGISPISLVERHDLKDYKSKYYLKLKQIIKYYIKKGYEIKLFSFCEFEGDLLCIREILKLLPKHYVEKIKVVNYTGQLDSFLRQFQSCSAIIGTRFHSLILAMIFQQQFLPLIYSDKMTNGLQEIGVENLGYHIKEIDLLDVNNIANDFNEVVNTNVYSDAEQHFAKLDQLLIS